MVVALASIAVLVVGFHRLRKTVDAARFMADYGSYLTGVHASLLRLLNSYSGEWRGDWEAERKEILIDFAVRVDGMEGSYPVTARRLLTWRQESGDRAVRVSGDQPYNEANREVARMELRIEMVLAEVRKQSTLDT